MEDHPAVVKIEISSQLLEKMLSNRALVVSDIRSLDAPSKASIYRLCLRACVEGKP